MHVVYYARGLKIVVLKPYFGTSCIIILIHRAAADLSVYIIIFARIIYEVGTYTTYSFFRPKFYRTYTTLLIRHYVFFLQNNVPLLLFFSFEHRLYSNPSRDDVRSGVNRRSPPRGNFAYSSVADPNRARTFRGLGEYSPD